MTGSSVQETNRAKLAPVIVRARWAELRTALTGIDPGRVRLRFASVAVSSMMVAAGVMTLVRLLAGQPVTVVLISGVLAMISNLAVNEPELHRLRVTTALMVGPAAVAVTGGTLLVSNRVVADVVFVAIMAVAVWARRFGPRANALGQAAVMAYFFTQFLAATVAQLPWLIVAAAVGIGSTLLLRGLLLADNPDRTLRRLMASFGAHVHGLVEAVIELVVAGSDERPHALRILARRRTRLNETALLVADQLEKIRTEHDAGRRAAPDDQDRVGADEVEPGLGRDELRVIDVELSVERLSVATRRLVDEGPPPDDARRSLVAGLRSLGAATATGAPDGLVPTLIDGARRSVAALVADTEGLGDRTQRVAFAVTRLADALDEVVVDSELGHPAVQPDATDMVAATPPPDGELPDGVGAPTGPGRSGPDLYTRQAVQVAVATGAAILVGELISPSRWYWAVIAAFIVFANTTSRGDVLSRGSQRVLGTIGGVAAGMALAFVVDGAAAPALVLMVVCMFLALYLVRVSQALMAFWITAVLALLYGLIGQFSVATLVLRIEETAAGAALGMLAGFLILPTGTRAAFGRALDELLAALHEVLDATGAQLAGRPVTTPPVVLARTMDVALGTLRARARPLDHPLPRRRGRSSYQRALRVFTAVDHYARRLARLSDTTHDPRWAATVEPALRQVGTNLDGLVALLHHRDGPAVVSAEEAVDAAEAQAARTTDPRLRGGLLVAVRMVRRIDQAVVGFADDLAAPAPAPRVPSAR